jgi:hypothetical protein
MTATRLAGAGDEQEVGALGVDRRVGGGVGRGEDLAEADLGRPHGLSRAAQAMKLRRAAAEAPVGSGAPL